MAIAPLMEYEGQADGTCGLLELPWPRAVLRVVPEEPGGCSELDVEVGAPAARIAPARATTSPGLRTGVDVAVRRVRRASVVRRRRLMVLGTAAAGLVAGLALPFGPLGGTRPEPAGTVRAAVTGATVYVVQPGDTLWSIAERFDGGGNPRPLAEALARETRSAIVVPGERVAVP